jgi:hypothetical protein
VGARLPGSLLQGVDRPLQFRRLDLRKRSIVRLSVNKRKSELKKFEVRSAASALVSGSKGDRNEPADWGDSSEKDTFSKYSGYIAAAASDESEELVDYDVEKMAKVFKKKPFLLARRVLQVGTSLGRWGILRFLDSKLGRSEITFKVQQNDLDFICIFASMLLNNAFSIGEVKCSQTLNCA